jgi:3-oxoadipate enol-lactonase
MVHIPKLGELFVRDTGGDGKPVLLLHGWMASADINWYPVYAPLRERGYRVIALDHRGHGRGLRTTEPFRLAACASDAAALVRHLGVGPLPVVGYSMGGPITMLMAQQHPDTVSTITLGATALNWTEPRMKIAWRSMGFLRLAMSPSPLEFWRWALRKTGVPDSPAATWVASELSRGSGRDLAEAGRELGRFDARPWARSLGRPASMIVTTEDTAVPPRLQYALAKELSAPVFEVPIDHLGIAAKAAQFTSALISALATVAPVTLHQQQ